MDTGEQNGWQCASDLSVLYACGLVPNDVRAATGNWKEQGRRTLADIVTRNKVLKATVREKKKREPLLLAEANALFEQLQVRGDLDRYKSLVKYASMGNQSLGTVKAFFDSENGQA